MQQGINSFAAIRLTSYDPVAIMQELFAGTLPISIITEPFVFVHYKV